jgi:cephalosporin hydroxylase
MLPPIPNTREMIESMQTDQDLQGLRQQLLYAIVKYRYSYNFTWFGRPIIQLPDDMITLQEIILSIRPDVIIETGVAHGGSLVFYASMLELLGENGQVLGIDIDIRPHNRIEIEKHSLFKHITLIEGSSVDPTTIDQVKEFARGKHRIMVVLDSNHTHDHVLQELNLYAPLVTRGSYLIVLDTVIEDLPSEYYPDRPWGPGNNPKTAVQEFLKTTDRFEIDKEIENKLLITVAPDGYLKCIKD